MQDIEEAKAAYGEKLTVLCGTELGQATFDLEAAEEVISDKRLDYVIGSMHRIPCCDDCCGLKFSSPKLVDIQLERYFKEVLKLCEWGKFNVLGHLTYPLRYIDAFCHRCEMALLALLSRIGAEFGGVYQAFLLLR